MKLEQLTQCMAATLASLFLILVPCAFLTTHCASTGIRIPMMRLGALSLNDCPDVPIFITIPKHGKLHINSILVGREDLAPRIASIMSYRAEKAVYVLPDSDISYGQFLDVLDKTVGSTKDLHIAILSGELHRAMTQKPNTFCELQWPQCEFPASTYRLPFKP